MNLRVTWNPARIVGVRAMDDQHAIMMETMNELRLALVQGVRRAPANELLDKLLEFTRLHFWNEEQLLERHGFPGLEAHRAEHRRLLEQITESAHRVQHSESLPIGDLLTFLHDWFINHVEEVDRQYGPWMNEREVY